MTVTDQQARPTHPAIERGDDSLTLIDADGDKLHAADLWREDVPAYFVAATRFPGEDDEQYAAVHLDYAAAFQLHQHLGDWVNAHGPQLPAEDDEDAASYAWPTRQATILDDAKDACYGERHADYGHPREDFTRTAILWTGLLQHLMADGEFITPEDVARCMIGVKLARDVHSPKRDNRVDMAGYALCLDRLETGQ